MELPNASVDDPRAQQASLLMLTVSHNHATGNFRAAEAEAMRLAELQLALLGPRDSRTIAAKSNLAELHRLMGHYSEAEGVYVNLIPSMRGGDHESKSATDVALILCNVGLLRSDRGDYVKAQEPLLEALAILRRTVGESDPSYAHVLNCLGTVRRNLGDDIGAKHLFDQAERIAAGDVGIVAQVQNNLGDLHHTAGDYPQAEECYRKCILLLRKQLGATHPRVALVMHNLAVLHRDRSSLEEAARLEKQACKIIRSTHGEGHPYYAMCLGSLAETELRQGDLSSAKTNVIRAAESLQQTVGIFHPLYASNLRVQAELSVEEGRLREAEVLLCEAEKIQSQVSRQGVAIRSIWRSMLNVYSQLGKSSEVSRIETLLSINAEGTVRSSSLSSSTPE